MCSPQVGCQLYVRQSGLDSSTPREVSSTIFTECLPVECDYQERVLVGCDAHPRRLDVNCLSDLPGSMVHLENLEELCLTSNFFAIFPDFAMKMSGLKKVGHPTRCITRGAEDSKKFLNS